MEGLLSTGPTSSSLLENRTIEYHSPNLLCCKGIPLGKEGHPRRLRGRKEVEMVVVVGNGGGGRGSYFNPLNSFPVRDNVFRLLNSNFRILTAKFEFSNPDRKIGIFEF